MQCTLLNFGYTYFIGLYPNVTLKDIGTPEMTAPSNLFIYTWPVEEQAKYPGNVTAIEYCFQKPASTHIQPVFTLLLLNQLSYGYRITDSIVVATKNFRFCSNRGGIYTCCERRPLRQFSIPSEEIEAFGISAMGDNRILGYAQGQQRSTLGFQVPVSEIIQNKYIVLSISDMIPINYRIFNFVIGKVQILLSLTLLGTLCDVNFTETSNSTTTQPTSASSSSVPDGEGNGSQTQLPVTASVAITSNSASSSSATDSENNSASSTLSVSTSNVTPSLPSIGSNTSTLELPTTGETTALSPEEASAQNSSSISVTVVSIIAGCIFALLHIVIPAVVIYLCYRARTGKRSVANAESVVNNPSSEANQPTVYESIYVQAVPISCTNINEPVDLEEADQHTYESSNYTLPIDIHGTLPMVLDRNPAYGCNDQFELEDPYASNSINKGLNSYTKILPPPP